MDAVESEDDGNECVFHDSSDSYAAFDTFSNNEINVDEDPGAREIRKFNEISDGYIHDPTKKAYARKIKRFKSFCFERYPDVIARKYGPIDLKKVTADILCTYLSYESSFQERKAENVFYTRALS